MSWVVNFTYEIDFYYTYIKMKEIQLSQGKVALVDDEDFERLSKMRWHAQVIGNSWYAKRHFWSKPDKKYLTWYMHRIVMNAPDSMVVDHKDHNTLNNQKVNLRVCTKAQNNINTSKRPNTSSKFKGVCYFKSRDKYIAYIEHASKRTYLGYHKTEEDAAKAYNKKAIEIHGQFAQLNQIQ